MAKKVLSVEIGQQITKAVVIDYLKKNPHVYNAFSFPTPEDVMEDGYVRDKERMADALKEQMKDNGVKERDVVFSIASSKIATREVTMPFVAENKIKEMVDATAQDYFPVKIEEYTLAYNVLEVIKENDKKSMKLLLLAAPDTLVQSYYSLADQLGMHVESIDYFGNGSMQVLQKHIVSGYNLSVQISSSVTMVSVLKEGQQIMQRSIPYGTDNIVSTILEQESLGCSNEIDAMELICRENIIYSTLDYDDIETIRSTRMTEDQWKRSDQNAEARQAVTDAVGSIILSVIRVVDYFGSRYPDSQLGNIYITGKGVKIRGIDILFEKEMDLPVRLLDRLTNITFSRGFARSLQDQTEYIAVIGAAIAPVGFRLKTLDGRESSGASLKVVRIAFGACAAVAVLLVAGGWFMLHLAESTNEELKDEKSKMAYIQGVYDENNEATQKNTEAVELDAATYNNNEQFRGLIDDLQTQLPKEVYVDSIQADGSSLSMALKSKTKLSAARLLMNFENIKCLTEIDIQAISSSEDVTGASKEYSYSVTATMVNASEVGSDDATVDGTTEGTSSETAQ